MNFFKQQLHIGGMTCINCENKISKTLSATKGITDVTVSYAAGTASFTYDADCISLNEIISIIEGLDYEVLTDRKEKHTNISRTVCFLIIIIALYILLQKFNILNLLVPSRLADTGMGYGMLFLIGIITSVHCIAMCGGINLSQCIPGKNSFSGKSSRLSAFYPALFYNLGRVISYTVIGFLLGLIGMLIGGGSGAGIPALLQGILKLAAGAFMVIMGINMLGLFPWLRKINPGMPKFLALKINRKKLKSSQPFIIGLLNGLMPCGPLQSMQIIALASGNPFVGALSMLLFSLGTVPLMLGLGSIVSALGKKFARTVMNIGSILVVVLGLAMLSQGGSLSGLLLPNRLLMLIIILSILGVIASLPFRQTACRMAGLAIIAVILIAAPNCLSHLAGTVSLEEVAAGAEKSEVSDDIQVVNSTLSPGSYPNITVQAGIPVKWVIDAPAGSINGCNYKMIINEYGIEHAFEEGENVIEFTPTQTGSFSYSCWMGMIHGTIYVTDSDTANASPAEESIDVPVSSGYQIPSEEFAVAELSEDDDGNLSQEVSISLTDAGFSPAVIVVQSGIQVVWNIEINTGDSSIDTTLLAPVYSTKLELSQGDNQLYLYPSESFDVSTGDHKFYAYIKVVDDINLIDTDAIRQEVDEYDPLIYPESTFENASGASCCG